MKIQSHDVEMNAFTTSFKQYTSEERLQVRVGNPVQGGTIESPPGKFMVVDLSQKGKDLLEASSAEPAEPSLEIELSDEDKAKIRLIENFIEAITGKKHRIRILGKIKLKDIPENAAEAPVRRGPQWSVSYQKTEHYHESQRLSFETVGKVRTADGRQIDVSLNLDMSYEFSQSSHFSFRAGNVADPLVINLDGTAPRLSAEKYSFDITIDGSKESISMPVGGQGLLCLDKNKDGIINDGSELFGASTGDGFAELARYDSDGNGWIDESDPVFSELKIMIRESGSDDVTLHSAKEKGVGAIYLGAVESPYELKNPQNETAGIIRKSGFYLKESGRGAGLIQHIDLSC
ncbi:MAG: hypothetical protein ACLFVQ_07310 [Chitinispirillaceae bacterium]